MPELPPRGGVLSTGEDCVQRRSAQGRSLIVKFTPEGEAGQGGSIDLGTLTALQAEAARGLYAQAMGAYVRHVARDRAATLERLDALTAEYKAKAKAAGVQGHARTAGIVTDLAAGFRLFAEWAASVGAIQAEVGARLADQHWSWLVTLADDQQEQQDESDDARRFIDLIISALGSGRRHLADAKGKPPEGWAAACGWTWYQQRRRPGQLGNRQPQQRPHRLARRRAGLPRRQRGGTANPSLRGPAKQALEQPRHRGCPPGGKGLAGGRADGGEDAVQDAEDPGGGPPDQPPGLRRPGLLAAGRPGARLATRPTPTGTPKDPPRRRVTASLAHQNHGSGPAAPPCAAFRSLPRLRNPFLRTWRTLSTSTRPPVHNTLSVGFPLWLTPQSDSTRVFTITKWCAQVRQKATLQPSEAASRGALGPF